MITDVSSGAPFGRFTRPFPWVGELIRAEHPERASPAANAAAALVRHEVSDWLS
jgi:hypothetical protein